MKKRYALYGMFAAMAIFATACGDDSSSGPEEESSSSIEAEDESSSSVEEEGKSSAADKKSSSSEAKKDDSSSSEKTTSSSSEAESSSSHYSTEPTCTDKTEGEVVTSELTYYATEIGDVRVVMAADFVNKTVTLTSQGTLFFYESCENLKDDYAGAPFSYELKSCSDTEKYYDLVLDYGDKMVVMFETIDKAGSLMCEELEYPLDIQTDYLNHDMLDRGEYGTFRDTRDAMLYRTIKIGDQTWMAQNLNYVTHGGNADDGVASWCYDDAESCAKYGRLYTWAAAMDKPEGSCGNGHVCGKTGTVQGICPDGWHLPSKEELHELLNFASTEVDSTTNLGESVYDVAGTKLQTSGTNEYGFSALLTGYYDDEYCQVENMSYFWSSSEKNADEVYLFYVASDFEGAILKSGGKDSGQSVRCIKD